MKSRITIISLILQLGVIATNAQVNGTITINGNITVSDTPVCKPTVAEVTTLEDVLPYNTTFINDTMPIDSCEIADFFHGSVFTKFLTRKSLTLPSTVLINQTYYNSAVIYTVVFPPDSLRTLPLTVCIYADAFKKLLVPIVMGFVANTTADTISVNLSALITGNSYGEYKRSNGLIIYEPKQPCCGSPTAESSFGACMKCFYCYKNLHWQNEFVCDLSGIACAIAFSFACALKFPPTITPDSALQWIARKKDSYFDANVFENNRFIVN
jgi:hypothetical protein